MHVRLTAGRVRRVPTRSTSRRASYTRRYSFIIELPESYRKKTENRGRGTVGPCRVYTGDATTGIGRTFGDAPARLSSFFCFAFTEKHESSRRATPGISTCFRTRPSNGRAARYGCSHYWKTADGTVKANSKRPVLTSAFISGANVNF